MNIREFWLTLSRFLSMQALMMLVLVYLVGFASNLQL